MQGGGALVLGRVPGAALIARKDKTKSQRPVRGPTKGDPLELLGPFDGETRTSPGKQLGAAVMSVNGHQGLQLSCRQNAHCRLACQKTDITKPNAHGSAERTRPFHASEFD